VVVEMVVEVEVEAIGTSAGRGEQAAAVRAITATQVRRMGKTVRSYPHLARGCARREG